MQLVAWWAWMLLIGSREGIWSVWRVLLNNLKRFRFVEGVWEQCDVTGWWTLKSKTTVRKTWYQPCAERKSYSHCCCCTLWIFSQFDSRWPQIVSSIALLWRQSVIETNKHPFNGLFSRTTWSVKPFLDFNEARGDEVAVASAGPYANHLHLITLFLQARCSSWRWSNSVEALKARCSLLLLKRLSIECICCLLAFCAVCIHMDVACIWTVRG